MTPLQFLARLCAIVPPPRHLLIRFHGVLATNGIAGPSRRTEAHWESPSGRLPPSKTADKEDYVACQLQGRAV